MRIIFIGTPSFASYIFEGLIKKGHKISLVLTKPDSYSGRGMQLKESQVKSIANQYHIECLSPSNEELSNNSGTLYNILLNMQPDVAIVVAYGLILPTWLLKLPKFGCINIHASLLPRWRGAAPINRAIEYGDTETGISIIQMDNGIDTGDIITQKMVNILPNYTAGDLYNILAEVGLCTIHDILLKLSNNIHIVAYKQSLSGVTYAKKITKMELLIDTSMNAISIINKIRAFTPHPSVKIKLPWLKEPVKIISAQALDIDCDNIPHGKIISLNSKSIDISTSKGILQITKIQKSGSKIQDIKQFINYLSNSKECSEYLK